MMRHRLSIFGLGVVLVWTTVTLAFNIFSRTDDFKICPGTEYCNSEYSSDPNATKLIEYRGFPYKVKVGSPDWCSQGTNGVCEAGKYHPGFAWQYFLYNAVVVVAPALCLAVAYLLRKNPHKAKIGLITVVLGIGSLWLGWLTTDYMQHHTVRGSGLDDRSQGKIVAGLPLVIELSPASSCGVGPWSEPREGVVNCAAHSINYGDLWNKTAFIYFNWLFWSSLYGLGTIPLLKLGKVPWRLQ